MIISVLREEKAPCHLKWLNLTFQERRGTGGPRQGIEREVSVIIKGGKGGDKCSRFLKIYRPQIGCEPHSFMGVTTASTAQEAVLAPSLPTVPNTGVRNKTQTKHQVLGYPCFMKSAPFSLTKRCKVE